MRMKIAVCRTLAAPMITAHCYLSRPLLLATSSKSLCAGQNEQAHDYAIAAQHCTTEHRQMAQPKARMSRHLLPVVEC